MAKLPVEIPELVKQFGPTLNRVPAGGWVGSEKEDRMVKTHCCFCGQQCGIQLRVRNNKVVGWEPWEDFPFNLGKLCPKGVKRYMQDEHPDRLKHPLQRVAGKGFEPISWDAALSRVVSEIQRIQTTYGNDAFAVPRRAADCGPANPAAAASATPAARRPDLRHRIGGVMSLRRQGTTLFAAMLVFVGATVVLQLWLLTVSVEALLSGEYKTLIPAAAGSTVLLAINAGLLRYVFRFDRDAQGE